MSLLYDKKQFNLFNVTVKIVPNDVLLLNGNERNLIVPKFARPLKIYFFKLNSLTLQ